jgi:hypothetical protein
VHEPAGSHAGSWVLPGMTDTSDEGRVIDLRDVANEPPSESIANENEIVDDLAQEDGFREQPAEHSIEEQLQGLVDPAKIRARRSPQEQQPWM